MSINKYYKTKLNELLINMITQATFKNANDTIVKLRDNRLSSWDFNMDRANDTTLTVTITHKSAGRISREIPIVHLLELMGGQMDTIEKNTKPKSKKKNKNKTSDSQSSSHRPTPTSTPTQSRMIPSWDGPHDGFCKVNVKVNGKLSSFPTLLEAQTEAIRLGPEEVGGITMYNNIYRLRKASSVTSNLHSCKKGEKSWLFKMIPETSLQSIHVEETVESNNENVEQESQQDTTDTTNNNTTHTDESVNHDMNTTITLTRKMKQYNNMMTILQNFEGFDAEGVEFSEWKYKQHTFRVLVNYNIIMHNNEVVGMRFYSKEHDKGYYPIFINNDDF